MILSRCLFVLTKKHDATDGKGLFRDADEKSALFYRGMQTRIQSCSHSLRSFPATDSGGEKDRRLQELDCRVYITL